MNGFDVVVGLLLQVRGFEIVDGFDGQVVVSEGKVEVENRVEEGSVWGGGFGQGGTVFDGEGFTREVLKVGDIDGEPLVLHPCVDDGHLGAY